MYGSLSIRLCGKYFVAILLASLTSLSNAQDSMPKELSLDTVLRTIKQNDFTLKLLKEESAAFRAEADAASYLPDPVVFAALQNLPTDTFALDQEPMTQLRVGVRQMFPRGDVLDINASVSSINANLQLINQASHWLETKKSAEQAWLDAWYWQKNLELLEQDQLLLTQLQGFIRSLYEVGARDQSDLIGADLELIKLDEKRIEARRNFQRYRQMLDTLANERLAGDRLPNALPVWSTSHIDTLSSADISEYLQQHPRIQRLNQLLVLSEKKVELVEQDFGAAWGVEVSYGMRDSQNMDGSDRPDLFTAGVTAQIPIFTDGKQRQQQSAAKQRTQVAQINWEHALSEMRFEIESLREQFLTIREQRVLYETHILPTLEKQRKSALQLYESDTGSLQPVLSLFLKEQAARTMHQRLRVDEQKHLSSLSYLLGLDATATQNEANEA